MNTAEQPQSYDLNVPINANNWIATQGKSRNVYIKDNIIIIVATNRLSAFDRHLTDIPFKGKVLTLLSLWWFNITSSIIQNYVIHSPHRNVIIGKRCKVFPIEFIVRGYITGTTSTSLWVNYCRGEREFFGIRLVDGLKKNQKLKDNLLTPTTKSESHDQAFNSSQDIVDSGVMTQQQLDSCSDFASKLFAFGQSIANQRGLILVDTKYEFGLDANGDILIVDELHTPDSSRYWIADSYEERFNNNQEPENIDKEFIRKWYVSQCDPYAASTLPTPPINIINELTQRYVTVYEMLTEQKFEYQDNRDKIDITTAIKNTNIIDL